MLIGNPLINTKLVYLLSELGKISCERQEEFPSKCALEVIACLLLIMELGVIVLLWL